MKKINYQQVGWDTTKYFNPTNMNQMDNGIKAACDKADANEAAIADVNSNLSNKIIYQEYDVTTASNPNVALGAIGSSIVTKDGYTPISAYPNDDAAYQGFCNLRHYLDGTSVVMMMSTSERTFRIRVWYKKD